MWIKAVICSLVLLTLCVDPGDCQPESPSGYRLARDATYFIVAPKRIRPNQLVQISTHILSLDYPELSVRAVIRRYDEEIASVSRVFTTTGSSMLQMWIPDNSGPGNYSLRMFGSADGGLGGYIFWNETALVFDAKQVSVFIQLSKPFFKQGQDVLFRVMPVEYNLMARSGSMDIYVVDATDTVVKRWLSMQTNAGGVLEMLFQLSHQPHYGNWKIRVKAWGYWYEKSFRVDEYFQPMMDVNVSAPLFIWEDDHALAGLIMSNLTLGQPVRGDYNISLQIQDPAKSLDPNKNYTWPTIWRRNVFSEGISTFMFTMDEMRKALGSAVSRLVNKELFVEVFVTDWYRHASQRGWSRTVIYSNEVDVILLGDTARTFKPLQSMDVYYAVRHKDGSPLMRRRRMIQVRGTEETSSGTHNIEVDILVRDDGIAHFTYKPRPQATFFRIRATYDVTASASDEMTAYRYYTPSESYIFITSSTEVPLVDQYMVFTVTTTTFIEHAYYLMISGGNIITGDKLDMSSRQKTFSIALSRDMMPEVHIIVWMIKEGEVIADGMNFFVNGTRINKVDMAFNRGKDFRGDTVELNLWSDPSSYVGFSGIQYNLWRYGYNPFITETDMIQEMMTYEKSVNNSFSHMWKLPEEQTHIVHFPAPSYAVDANKTFEYSGLLVFTDANVTRVPHFCNETLGWFPCMDGTCYSVEQWCDGVRQCMDGQDEMGCPSRRVEVDLFTPASQRLNLVTRHYTADGQWLWGGHFLMPYGRLDLRTTVPEEALSYVMSAFGISRTLGFGVHFDPIRHEATRPFYMRIEGPGEAIKGEQIGIRVALFNYWEQDIECLVMLRGSTEYKFVVVEDFGIVSSYNPRTITGDVQTMVFLDQGQVVEIRMPVLPAVRGCINVTITADAFIYSDVDTVTICTQFDGVTNYYHTPFTIDLINSGSLVLPDLYVPVPDRFIKPGERQHLYVPGSPICHAGIVGDVVGPGFYEDRLDAESLLYKPYGASEQHMFNFAYKLYNLKYLKASNQLRGDVRRKALEEMNMDLQRLLSYMNADGSFSMFRDYQEHTPSTWASAFILKVLSAANDKDWELDFFIPVELLNNIGNWLCRQQNVQTGAFYEKSPLYDRKHWSTNRTVFGGELVSSNYSLTAYVVASLAMADQLTGAADTCKSESIIAAQKYLEMAVMRMNDVYTLAVTTYALHLIGSSQRTEAFDRLNSMKRTIPYVYWASKKIPENNVSWIDNIPYYQPRDWYDNEGHGVESTSYALLTYLLQNRLLDAQPLMKWLQTVRNTYAGMASTQDSIAALEALVEYARLDTNRDLYNIEVLVLATSMGNYSKPVRMHKGNWPDQQAVNIFPVYGSVRGRAQGSGMALMQLHTKANVEYPHQIRPQPHSRYFDVEIESWNFTGRNFSIMEVRPCARWARSDLSNTSGLAVLEMHVPTGYIVTNDVLRAYAQSGDVPTLRRAEQYDRKVVFYFDYLVSHAKTCVHVRLDRWYPVANMTIQHKLRVFDYYEPGMHNTTLYNTWHLFNLHICQVCGSFQCPFCIFYNSGASWRPNWTLALFTILLASMASRRFSYFDDSKQ